MFSSTKYYNVLLTSIKTELNSCLNSLNLFNVVLCEVPDPIGEEKVWWMDRTELWQE